MSKKITLFCAAGMSTSLLVSKMKEEAAKNGWDYEIAAYSLTESAQQGPLADVILLGPQVRYAVSKMKADFPDKPVASIEMRDYGMMNGKAVLAVARKYLGEE
ncbi:MAG: PTS sugar transporter subunit IIB [Solobacterium sp.]|jgi:PTS system cellobiose-specific IIB component|nr:PTS sugar transporter subunit IIB [Erysipelotrichaceae bacterium]MBQ9154304.1 PTS sugar transporter subunit IIB [Solobacterium sp.]